MKSRSSLLCALQIVLGVKSNNGRWIVTKATPYGKESIERSIAGDCHQKPLFSQNHFPPMRGQCGQGAIWCRMVLLIPPVTLGPLLFPAEKSQQSRAERGGRSFKRKRALGERAWNGQTLAASSTGQQLRQGSQLGQKGQRWAIEGRLGMPRPAPPHALRPCSFSSPNTSTPVKPLKSKCCIFGAFL